VKFRKKVKRTLMRNSHMLPSLPPAPTSMPRESVSANRIGTGTGSRVSANLAIDDMGIESPDELEWTAAAAAAFDVQNLSNTSSSEASEGGKIVPLPEVSIDFDEDLSSLQAPPGLELFERVEGISSSCTNSMSAGSFLHETGACQPCAWFWKAGGCQNGEDCMRCHTCPPGEVKARRKAKRTLMRLGLMTPKAKAE